MFTGWWKPLRFRVDRVLTEDERKAALSRQEVMSDDFSAHGSLVALNSTYIEWIDRRFMARGSINTSLTLLGSVGVFAAASYLLLYKGMLEVDLDAKLVAIFGFVLISLFSILLYYAQPRYDFFKKIYYPIRFNRKNRMVYVYRDKQDGGILSVPWSEVFFHVGMGMRDRQLCDIRGEILENKIVKDTFALGHYFEQRQPIEQMWSFICHYMEIGPEAVGQNPLDRYITLSINPGFRNCLVMAYSFYGATNMVVRIISLPFIALTTITRWLVFKTCSMPIWPAEIEDACKIAPNDPNVWPTPRYTGQFADEIPGLLQRATERSKEASGSSSLADQFGEWQRGERKK